ncbi:hypothetical protein ABZW18_32845 [Streptomyces sp. NPDC004647]|uniref:hypothetical protein n=1 Tax=Streptomyces sp. NPDC004647 TaxID=3154671 RepID=UPI0033B76573
MHKQFAAGLGTMALTAGMLLALPGATAHAAAYPTSSFNVSYGQTYTKGTLTWYNQSVNVSGGNNSVSSSACRATWARTFAGGEQLGGDGGGHVCNGNKTFSFTVQAQVAGGASAVEVCLEDGSWNDLACKIYYRP